MLAVSYFHVFLCLHECKVRLPNYTDHVDMSYFGICVAGTIIPTFWQALERKCHTCHVWLDLLQLDCVESREHIQRCLYL